MSGTDIRCYFADFLYFGFLFVARGAGNVDYVNWTRIGRYFLAVYLARAIPFFRLASTDMFIAY